MNSRLGTAPQDTSNLHQVLFCTQQVELCSHAAFISGGNRETEDPEVLEEFKEDNWVVNKNPEVPFCAISADHALEHINCTMKVTGGLVGITLNQSAHTKFFLILLELARISSEAQELARVKPVVPVQHHTMTTAFQSRKEKNVAALTDTLKSFTNPFD